MMDDDYDDHDDYDDNDVFVRVYLVHCVELCDKKEGHVPLARAPVGTVYGI